MSVIPPVPANAMQRVISLSGYDLDYSDMQNSFRGLAKLAAKIAGTEISQINLIDAFTQWTISSYGLPPGQARREDTACQYTILATEPLEVKNLIADDRFKDLPSIKGGEQFRYYLGVPLTTDEGDNLGSLCVLDRVSDKKVGSDEVELLESIAVEIVKRFAVMKQVQDLKNNVQEADQTRRKVAHDIRGPLGGIISLAQLISMQEGNKQVLEFSKLIQQSGNSILELADEILGGEKKVEDTNRIMQDHETTLELFKQKLEQLYLPQAMNKQIRLSVQLSEKTAQRPFTKNKLLQIIGNLVSNAIKFTPDNGEVKVNLDLQPQGKIHQLSINVTDTGMGMDKETIAHILTGDACSTNGTAGEQGYGFGLPLVKHLVDQLHGTMQIESTPGEGTHFQIKIVQ